MKHAGPDALDRLESLLGELRKIAALKERSRGVFYRSGRAFLHFHEHGAELFADMRVSSDFERFETTTAAHRNVFLKAVKRALAQ